MNISMVFHLLGKVLLCEGALLALPLAVSLIYLESGAAQAFVITMALCLVLGGAPARRKPRNRVFYLREGFVITALSWIIISICLLYTSDAADD